MPSTDPDDYDFSSPDVQRCPYPFYEAVRQHGPAYRLPGQDVYVVARHADVLAGLKHPEVFSSRRPPVGAADPEIAAIDAKGWSLVPTLTNNDPPSHARYRRLISRVFTPRSVTAREPDIRRLVDELIDDFAADGRVEFIGQFADLLPSYVLGDWLGQPREMGPQLKAWAKDITQAVNPVASREQVLGYKRSFVEFQHYFADEIEKKRANPQDDFLTQLATAEIDGEQLRLEELLDLLRVFINGGNETMTSLLSGTMFHLARNPDQLAAVIADRSLIPAAVEEGLRYESAAQWFPRLVTEGGAEVGGVPIPAGSRVIMVLASANRDESMFPDADRFDITRDATGHLTFGYGIHFCSGAPLARLEARIAFERLFERLADLRLAVPADEVEYVPQQLIRQIVSLPLSFTPA